MLNCLRACIRILLKFYYQCVMDLNALPGQIVKEITVSSFIHIMK